jgi:hypothetical protein
MNKWGIPLDLENRIRKRDKNCIYCGVKLQKVKKSITNRKDTATWEHIVNDSKIVTFENIALCCNSCNASKGSKILSEWLKSAYCEKHKISEKTVSGIVKNALKKKK